MFLRVQSIVAPGLLWSARLPVAVQLAVVADSHVPTRAAAIPDPFEERIRTADHVVHAGDFTSREALEHVRGLATDLTAVHGNMDGRELGLPATTTLSVEGLTFVVTHGTGSPAGYEERVAGVVRERGGEGAVGIAGHTHEVEDTVVDGVRLLNPGSVTGAAPAERATMMTVGAGDGGIDVTVHELDR